MCTGRETRHESVAVVARHDRCCLCPHHCLCPIIITFCEALTMSGWGAARQKGLGACMARCCWLLLARCSPPESWRWVCARARVGVCKCCGYKHSTTGAGGKRNCYADAAFTAGATSCGGDPTPISPDCISRPPVAVTPHPAAPTAAAASLPPRHASVAASSPSLRRRRQAPWRAGSSRCCCGRARSTGSMASTWRRCVGTP